jgi:hypothetical protein
MDPALTEAQTCFIRMLICQEKCLVDMINQQSLVESLLKLLYELHPSHRSELAEVDQSILRFRFLSEHLRNSSEVNFEYVREDPQSLESIAQVLKLHEGSPDPWGTGLELMQLHRREAEARMGFLNLSVRTSAEGGTQQERYLRNGRRHADAAPLPDEITSAWKTIGEWISMQRNMQDAPRPSIQASSTPVVFERTSAKPS